MSQLFDLDSLLTQRLSELVAVKKDLKQDSFDEQFMLTCLESNQEFVASIQADLLRRFGPLEVKAPSQSKEVQTIPERRSPQPVPPVPIQKPATRPASQPDEELHLGPLPQVQQHAVINIKPVQTRKSKEMVFATAAQIDNPVQKSGRGQIEELARAFQGDAERLQAEKQEKEKQEKDKEKDKEEGEEKASKMVQSLLQDGVLSTPSDTLESIHGMSETKQLLSDTVLIPLQFPELFAERQVSNRVLLHSLPGCGKSFVARCIAGETKRPLISVSPGQLFSKYQGTSERTVRALFQLAQQKKPCVLFLDELDALCSRRGEGESESSRRVKNQLLVELDGLSQDVLLLGATNLPWEIDAAVRRRFERRVFVALPDMEARESMVWGWVKAKLEEPGDVANRACETGPQTVQHDGTEDNNTLSDTRSKRREICAKIAAQTEGYTGADLKVLCKAIDFVPIQKLQFAKFWTHTDLGWQIATEDTPEAVQKNMRDLAGQKIIEPALTWDDVAPVLGRIKASVRPEDVREHLKFQNQFGSD